MATINLLITKQEDTTSYVFLRKWSKKLATVALVLYLVAAVCYLGWFFYNERKSQSVSGELSGLNLQVNGLAKEEVLIRRLDERVTLINAFLKGRPNAFKMSDILAKSGVRLRTWVYKSGTGLSSIKIDASASAEVHRFVDYMEDNYANVRLDAITFRPDDGWMGEVSTGGLIP